MRTARARSKGAGILHAHRAVVRAVLPGRLPAVRRGRAGFASGAAVVEEVVARNPASAGLLRGRAGPAARSRPRMPAVNANRARRKASADGRVVRVAAFVRGRTDFALALLAAKQRGRIADFAGGSADRVTLAIRSVGRGRGAAALDALVV